MPEPRRKPTFARMPLYPSEERIVEELFGDAASDMMKSWRETAIILERNGLPKKDPLFGNRRYWPSVRRWLDFHNGITSEPGTQAPDGPERW